MSKVDNYFHIIFLIVCISNIVTSTPIDNGVEGDPEIECGPNTITVNFNTRNNFEGHVFVKGRFAESGCRSDQTGKKSASISLPFSTCGVDRQRNLNPKGLFVGVSVVITFHPQFLTKVDRAYSVQCFYMEADKTVSQDLDVSEITTAFQTQVVPMPICRYEILEENPNGPPVHFAGIGQQVYHKWTCDTESIDIFCMLVHSCFVDDNQANRIQLLNEQGCALDRFLLGNLEYISDLMAGKESHVFKFADKPALAFQCQVSISVKEPDVQCPRPQCPDLGGAIGSIVPGPAATNPPSPGGTDGTRGSPRTPPLGRTPPNGSKPPGTAAPTSPKPIVKSSPSVVPPSTGAAARPSGAQPNAPGLALPVLAPLGRTLPAAGSLLSLPQSTKSTSIPTRTTGRPTGSSTSRLSTGTTGTTKVTAKFTSPSSTPHSSPRSSSTPHPTSTASTRRQSTDSTSISSSTRPIIAPPSVAPPPGIAPPAPPAFGANPPSAIPPNFANRTTSTSTQQQTSSSTSGTLQSSSTSTIVPVAAPVRPPAAQPPPPPPPPSNIPGRPSEASPRFDFESTFPFRLRRVRSANEIDYAGTWDVRAQPITTYEDFDNLLTSNDLRSFSSRKNNRIDDENQAQNFYCFPTLLIGLIASVTLLSLLASIIVALFICLRRKGPKYYVD